jgi:hypothetical protein
MDEALAAEGRYVGPTITEEYLDEELVYNIGFWFLDNVAIGNLTLKKGRDSYVARLTAQTTGAVDWFLRHRKDTYVSRMDLSPDGGRFITRSFEQTVQMDGRLKRKITIMDYERGLMTIKKWKGSGTWETVEIRLKPGLLYDDPLAAFYNFRHGVYGPIAPGAEFRITTLPKVDRVPEIMLRLTGPGSSGKGLRGVYDSGYLAEMRLEKDLFGSQSGDIEIAFTDEMVPVEAVAKDILLFGDVRGRLGKKGEKGFKASNGP